MNETLSAGPAEDEAQAEVPVPEVAAAGTTDAGPTTTNDEPTEPAANDGGPAIAATGRARPKAAPAGQPANLDTAFAVLGPAAAEAASLVTSALGLDAQAGDGTDLWGVDGAALAPMLSKETKVWSASLMSSSGVCGEVALALQAGVPVPGEGRLASALAACMPALASACGAQHLGKLQRQNAETLREARPGQRALALPLLLNGERSGLLVIVVPASQAAAELPHLDPAPGPPAVARSIAALGDVEMSVSVELGRTKIPIKDLLSIHNGAVVQLDRAVSHPVDVFVNGTLIARGEVVVVDECFAVRVTELLTGD